MEELSPGEVQAFAMVWLVALIVLQATILSAFFDKGRVAVWFSSMASIVILATAAIIYPYFIPKLGSHSFDGAVVVFMVGAVLLAVVAIANLVHLVRNDHFSPT